MSHIGNESAYMRATEAAIKRNRATGGLRRWIEREGEEAVDMVKDWLFCEHIYGTKHPLAFYSRGKFMDAMRAAIDNWGGLSEKQHAAVIDAYHRAEKLSAEHEQARAAALKEDRERTRMRLRKEERLSEFRSARTEMKMILTTLATRIRLEAGGRGVEDSPPDRRSEERPLPK